MKRLEYRLTYRKQREGTEDYVERTFSSVKHMRDTLRDEGNQDNFSVAILGWETVYAPHNSLYVYVRPIWKEVLSVEDGRVTRLLKFNNLPKCFADLYKGCEQPV